MENRDDPASTHVRPFTGKALILATAEYRQEEEANRASLLTDERGRSGAADAINRRSMLKLGWVHDCEAV